MAKRRNETEATCDYPRFQRKAGWSPEARNAAGSILLVSLGAVVGFLAWLGISSVNHDSDIAVLKDSDETTKVHIVESNSKIRSLELRQQVNDTEDRIHHNDKYRHRTK